MAIVKISDLPLVDSPVEGTDLFVVVQDNVTKKAYASDIQTYVGFEEIQYATAGQTVFNLTTMTYAAGANNLMVFVDGVNQYEGLSYTETDNNTVTFTQGLHVGAVVKFSTVQTQTSLVNNAAAVVYNPAGTGAVPTNVQDKLRESVSVKDFGAVGDGIVDDTAAIQAAINQAQDNSGIVFVPSGFYKITSTLVVDGGKPLYLYGAGRSSFNGSTLIQEGTIFKLATPNTSLFNITSGLAVKHFNNFSAENISGGSNEIAFGNPNGADPYFGYFADLTIGGFEHAFKFARSLYLRFDRLIIRDCDYGIDCWQFTGTPPFILNDTGGNGYFNNIITVRDCQVVSAIIGYRLVGACIDIRNCDSSSYTTAGFVFGGSNFTGGTLSADQLYAENGTSTAVSITNLRASIGTVFFAGSDAIGVDITSSDVTLDFLNSYAVVTLGVKNTNSKVFWSGGHTGTITTLFQNFGTGVTRVAFNENVRQITGTLADTQTLDVPTEGGDNRTYQLDVYGSDNGVSNFGFRIIQRGNNAYIIGSKPANLTITTPLSGSGNRNVRIANTAGVPYSFIVFVNYSPSYYTIPL